MRTRSSPENEARYKAIQADKASRFGGQSKLPVCKTCCEHHVRCPGPEVDDNDNYDYDKKCLRCICEGHRECDFKSKMSGLAKRALDVMTEAERSVVMKTNKERGKMHPREVNMPYHRRRQLLRHSDPLSSESPASQLSQSAIRARALERSSNTSSQPSTTQPLATQPLATQLPNIQPPTIQQFTTQPPTTQQFATQQFNTKPPTTQQFTTQPPTTQQFNTQQFITQPPTTQQFNTQPPTTQQFATQPFTTQPFTTQLSSLIIPDARLVEYTAQPSQLILPDGRVIEYTIVPAEHVDNATHEHAYEAASHDIAQAIQEQEDRRMALHLPPQSMYPDPSDYEQAPTTPLWW